MNSASVVDKATQFFNLDCQDIALPAKQGCEFPSKASEQIQFFQLLGEKEKEGQRRRVSIPTSLHQPQAFTSVTAACNRKSSFSAAMRESICRREFLQPRGRVRLHERRRRQQRFDVGGSTNPAEVHALIREAEMARSVCLVAIACAFALLMASSMASAGVVEYTFHVSNMTLKRLCNDRVITAVNGSLPGPTIHVREGDNLLIHVNNNSPYNLTIHWHGIFQLLSAWADGPAYATQCPIRPGNSYTYNFTITGQEGTLWWHAHVQWLRATVYGALVIQPRATRSYHFQTPYQEVPILFGEWWNANVVDVENQAIASGGAPNNSDAFTINGLPGDLYPCTSQNETYQLKVKSGKTYLLRIVNAALNNQLFFKIAQHNFTVVAIDACYTNPYSTDVVVIAPGQTTDVLLTANQSPGTYYMAARPYASAPIPFDNTTTRGMLVYDGANSSQTPPMPILPAFNDTPTAHKFYSNLTAFVNGPFWAPVPTQVDHNMYVTVGLGLVPCGGSGNGSTCQGLLGQRFAASMNNFSFQFPTTRSMLEAFFYNLSGIYTTGFPDNPPTTFDYTNANISTDQSLIMTTKSTTVKQVEYNSTVQIVLQNTAFVTVENHPMHLHGFDFYVLAQGFGNYDANKDPKKFNLRNPQVRNTIAVPVGGWAAIRFRANNPGVWLMHCHLDTHLPWGLATAFVVKNGGTPGSTLPPPPADLPRC
ncbi:laccase-7-like [Malania oleifera]|uniref:laccase-7-like n=1 Tax=Malania oleifera TaxID=397392 RepID=UPI0025ADF4CB|nr:laccase-7-like [Malania oleifera]